VVLQELSSSWIERARGSDSQWISDGNSELFGWFFHIGDSVVLFLCDVGRSGWDYALQATFGLYFGSANEGHFHQWYYY
jgi:hypothetical protein